MPVIGFVVLGLVVALAFTKVAISGFGDVDRWSIRLLAGATLAGGDVQLTATARISRAPSASMAS